MTKKILLTGTAVINRLLHSLDLDLLVRTQDVAAKLRTTCGDRITPVLWGGLLKTPFIESTAGNYHVIINVTSGFIAPGA